MNIEKVNETTFREVFNGTPRERTRDELEKDVLIVTRQIAQYDKNKADSEVFLTQLQTTLDEVIALGVKKASEVLPDEEPEEPEK